MATAQAAPALEVVAGTDTVQKPVTNPKQTRQPRTGAKPVVKAVKAPKAPKEPREVPLSKEERQKLKFLIQRKDERDLLDTLLKLAVEDEMGLQLTTDQRKVADQMWTRSQRKR